MSEQERLTERDQEILRQLREEHVLCGDSDGCPASREAHCDQHEEGGGMWAARWPCDTAWLLGLLAAAEGERDGWRERAEDALSDAIPLRDALAAAEGHVTALRAAMPHPQKLRQLGDWMFVTARNEGGERIQAEMREAAAAIEAALAATAPQGAQ